MSSNINLFIQFSNTRFNHQAYDFGNTPVSFGNRPNGSDISAHLPFLQFIASRCNHVTEFGCRDCYSTCAFLSGCKNKVVSYDIKESYNMQVLKTLNLPCIWEYKIQDTLDINLDIEETDFLFIDSLHTYNQVKGELRFANKVSQFIGFHDVVSQGKNSLDIPGEEGINRAIEEFLEQNKNWHMAYYAQFNHGLLLLEKHT